MTRQEIFDLIVLLITSNTNREITAQRLRTVLQELNDSSFNLQDNANDFVRPSQIADFGFLPVGGNTDRVLGKVSNTDFDVDWITQLLINQLYTVKQSFALSGANPSQAINLDNGSYISVDLTGASGTATITLTNGKVGASYWIEFLQAATAVNVSLANSGRYDGETGSTIAGTDGVDFDVIALHTGSGFKINVMEVS